MAVDVVKECTKEEPTKYNRVLQQWSSNARLYSHDEQEPETWIRLGTPLLLEKQLADEAFRVRRRENLRAVPDLTIYNKLVLDTTGKSKSTKHSDVFSSKDSIKFLEFCLANFEHWRSSPIFQLSFFKDVLASDNGGVSVSNVSLCDEYNSVNNKLQVIDSACSHPKLIDAEVGVR